MNTPGPDKIFKTVETVAEIGNIFGEGFEDGKINMDDIHLVSRLPGVATSAFAVIANSQELRDEFAALTPAEIVELKDKFKLKFDIPQDNVETIIERTADIIDVLWNGFQAIYTIFKNKKAE